MKALMLPSMCSASAGEFARSRALGEALEEEERGERWETAIEEVRERSGWREGETFVFGYGALLSTSVFTRRCLLPSMHPLPLPCCVMPGEMVASDLSDWIAHFLHVLPLTTLSGA